jgi:hypothetical protein
VSGQVLTLWREPVAPHLPLVGYSNIAEIGLELGTVSRGVLDVLGSAARCKILSATALLSRDLLLPISSRTCHVTHSYMTSNNLDLKYWTAEIGMSDCENLRDSTRFIRRVR